MGQLSNSTLDTKEITRRCARLRDESGALIVLAIRPADVAWSADAKITPKELGELVEGEIAALVQHESDRRYGGTHVSA
ncbi:MAG: hypothetical protein P4K83_02265 [Terracidiphilus sp.]|nr:hypothetical protein [Terracidiphilus sp.]